MYTHAQTRKHMYMYFFLKKSYTNVYSDNLNLSYYENSFPNIVIRNYDFKSLYGNFNLENCLTWKIRNKKGNKTNNDKMKLDILKLKRGLYTVLISTI